MSGLQGVKVGDPVWVFRQNGGSERRFVTSAGPKWVHAGGYAHARDSGAAKDGFGFALTEQQYKSKQARSKLLDRARRITVKLEDWHRRLMTDEQVGQRSAVVEQIEKLLEDG